MSVLEISTETFVITDNLGSGTYGTVKMGQSTQDERKKVAVKIVKSHFSAVAKKEYDLLRKLSHPSIVGVHALITLGDLTYLVMDKLGDDLFNLIMQYPNGIPEMLMKQIAREVGEALVYAHSQDIVHLDLKPENILFSQSSRATLIDWGLGMYVPNNMKITSFVGSFQYCAPEILIGLPFDGKKADVWSFGVLLYVCLTGLFPWPGSSNAVIRKNILAAHYTWTDTDLSSEVKDLVGSLLVSRSSFRIDMAVALEHPWFLI
jgi:serine/threonine protein kinase